MPVFIYEEDALEKMGCVEGKRWLDDQKADTSDVSFSSFLKVWQKFYKGLPSEFIKKHPKMCVIVNGHTTIYGHLGVNRYSVKLSGEIVYSSLQGSNPEEAKKAGFTVD